MWIAFLLLLPLPLSVHAEDLGELSTNPVRLSGSFGLSGMSGFSGLFGLSGFIGFPISHPNERGQRQGKQGAEQLEPVESPGTKLITNSPHLALS